MQRNQSEAVEEYLDTLGDWRQRGRPEGVIYTLMKSREMQRFWGTRTRHEGAPAFAWPRGPLSRLAIATEISCIAGSDIDPTTSNSCTMCQSTRMLAGIIHVASLASLSAEIVATLFNA